LTERKKVMATTPDLKQTASWLAAFAKAERAEATRKLPVARPGCLGIPVLRTGLLHNQWSEASQRHLRRCPSCQQALARLRERLWHPSLLTLFRHAWKQGDPPSEADVVFHLTEDRCVRCQRLVELVNVDPLCQRIGVWVGQVNQRWEQVKGLFRSLAATYGPALPIPGLQSESESEIPFAFEDDATEGRLLQEEGKHWLTIVRRALSPRALPTLGPQVVRGRGKLGQKAGQEPPVLHRLLLADRSGAVEQYLVFPAGNATLKVFLPVEHQLTSTEQPEAILLPVLPEWLTGADVAAVRSSFENARTQDVASLAHWKTWAQDALSSANDPQVRALLFEISSV
jgi:hypothetical protein